MAAALDDPSDAERLAEALRLAGIPVYDARLLKVAMDSEGVPKEPGPDDVEGRRNLAALRQLEGAYGKKEGGPLADLLSDLGEGKAAGYENARRDQLLMSTNDETQDSFKKLAEFVGAGPEAMLLAAVQDAAKNGGGLVV